MRLFWLIGSCFVAAALAASPGPIAVGAPVAAAAGPAPVVSSSASELWPAASPSYLAWSEAPRTHPRRYRALVKPAGEKVFRVSKKGRLGFPGGIDGDRLVFTETGKSSNIRLVDLTTRERLRLPDQVNTKGGEWGATISGKWLLFGRVEPGRGRSEVSKIFLFDLDTGEGRELAASDTRSLEPGQVNGDWALWHKCSTKNCSTFRYRISEGSREKISLAQPTFSGSIASDGTAYFAASRPACGKEVSFYEYPVGGPAKLLFKLPGGVDVYSSYAYEDGGATKIVFARIKCSTLRGDVYSFDPAGAGPPPDVGPDIAVGKGTVAYQVDVAHSGQLGDSVLRPPLRKLWTTELGEGISYPLVADGKVFVTVGENDDIPTAVYALDASTGTIAWFRELTMTDNWANAAFDDGKLFVVTTGGVLLALDADDGRELWSTQLPDQRSFSSPPTADAGMVYTAGSGSGGTFYAVRQSDGVVLWTKDVMNGHDSSPALSSDTVYVAYEGPQVYAFDRVTGAERWHHSGCCQGGGGNTPAFHDGYIYVRSHFGDRILDASTGERIGTLDARFAPAFSGSMGFFVDDVPRLIARGVPSGSVEWSFRGDGYLSTSPVVANGHVYMGSGLGHVYALDRSTGNVVWRGEVEGEIPWQNDSYAIPVTGLGLGRGILLVPHHRQLSAFVNR